jgi:hypothetical protein
VTSIAQVAEVVGRAVTQPAFRQQLLSAPAATLRSAGIEVPATLEVRVIENTHSMRYLVLPSRPEGLSGIEPGQPSPPSGAASSTAEKLSAHARLVVDTWSDAKLKARLLKDPAAVLAERGISMPPATELRVVEATDSLVYLALPPATSR